MAITIRKGIYSDFVQSSLQPGEFADVTSGDPNTSDGRALYICLASGNVVRIASSTDIDDIATTVNLDLATWAANLAPEYSASSGYSVGDFAVHNSILYKCRTTIPAGGEAWNASHWTQTTIMDLVPDIDTTLTISGDTADAKVVGDKIDDLQNALDNNAEVSFSGSDITCGWEIGGYLFNSGNKTNLTSRIRTKEYIDTSIKYISADSAYAEFGLLAYDTDGSYVGCWNGSQLTKTTAWIAKANINTIGNYNYKLTVRDKNDTSKDIGVEYANYLNCSTNIGYNIEYNTSFINQCASIINQCFRGEAMISSVSALSSFDDALINRYYSINSTAIPGAPVQEKGHLMYFGLNGGENTPSSGREVQIFVTNKGGFYYRYNRFSSGAPWSDWNRVAVADDIPDVILPSVSMFESFGVIGDSFASGEIYDSVNNTHADYYALSWGQVLSRMCGNTCVNYSVGGLTTKTWLTNANGLAKLNAETPNNLYVIALGINDANKLGTAKLGTIADIESDETDSFYSYYGRIVRAIMSHAPNAIIMLSTLARSGTVYDQFSSAVRNIGQYYNFAVLDLATSEFFNSTFFATHQISNHPTAVNYSAMAKEYRDLIEEAMEANASLYDGYTG